MQTLWITAKGLRATFFVLAEQDFHFFLIQEQKHHKRRPTSRELVLITALAFWDSFDLHKI